MKTLFRTLGTRRLVIGLVVVVLVAILLPMLPVPFTQIKPSIGCAFPTQIVELERFGRVEVEYRTPFWTGDDNEWKASFSSNSDGEYLSISSRKATICEAVDDLYYKVMEHPLKAK